MSRIWLAAMIMVASLVSASLVLAEDDQQASQTGDSFHYRNLDALDSDGEIADEAHDQIRAMDEQDRRAFAQTLESGDLSQDEAGPRQMGLNLDIKTTKSLSVPNRQPAIDGPAYGIEEAQTQALAESVEMAE